MSEDTQLSADPVEQIARAVLYEGYILYPYRRALKNRHRWTFGGVFPRAYSRSSGTGDAWTVRSQCLAVAPPEAKLNVRVAFLHLVDRSVGSFDSPLTEWPAAGEPSYRRVDELWIDGECLTSWQEAIERCVELPTVALAELIDAPRTHSTFFFPASRQIERLSCGLAHSADAQHNADVDRRKAAAASSAGPPWAGMLIRQQFSIQGSVKITAKRLEGQLYRITARLRNATPLDEGKAADRDAALMRCFAAAHLRLKLLEGQFVSMIDPEPPWQAHAAQCRSSGLWPALVGPPHQKDTMLAAPIILYDHPQIANASPGDLFDATEIDEMLALRVQTLSDDEKREALGLDPQGRALLERIDALAREQMMRLHAAMQRAP